MSRLDYKHGKFTADFETNRVFQAMEGWRKSYGDVLRYYRFNQGASQMDPVYDEAVGAGRVYYPPIALPCQHVTHVQGENEYGEYGMYHNDTLTGFVSFAAFTGVGLTYSDIETGNYLDDRVEYDRKIFRVTQLITQGQIQQRDILVLLRATQLKSDELCDDPTFAPWALGGPFDLSTGEN
jgi:hypothetical protein